MILTIISLVVLYCLSSYGQYRYIRIAHSKGGIWENVTPNGIDVFVTFFPIINTIVLIICYLSSSPSKKLVSKGIMEFFNIKK
jgi:hypothetical protein